MGADVRWFDNHCHFTSLRMENDAIRDEAHEAGVHRMLTVGCTLEDSKHAIAVASEFDDVYATAGIHPHDAKDGIEGLEALLAHEQVVAVGECGLDYHYDHSPRDVQKTVFAEQIRLAHAHDLAMVIHTRDAWEDTFEILETEGMPERTVFHCFTGGPVEAERCLELGAFLSFSGIVTFKTADDLRAAAALTPLDRVLVETDSPYLTPVPHRGKPNRPALVPLVGAAVAEAQRRSVEEVAEATWVNGSRLYNLVP